jgi:hydroxypyruvate reductase
LPQSADTLLSLYDAAIGGADPAQATARAIASLAIPQDRRILLFAVGKAAASMANAAVESLLKSLHQIAGGIVVSPEQERTPYPTVVALRGDHPVPGRQSFAAAARIGELAAGKRANDVVMVLVSGGASSLVAAPLRNHTEQDLTALYQSLLGSGLDIASMNVIRKRFARWGGGRLALALAPAATFCLAVSDVPGDDISIIGSGPCAADPSTATQVSGILEAAGLSRSLAAAHRDYLLSVSRGVSPETPKLGHPAFAHVTSRVIATNRTALDSAAVAAMARGMAVEIVEDQLEGAAADAGAQIARKLIAARATRNGAAKCVIWGGETTVSVGDSPAAVAGGGRCQELVLAAARVLGEAGDAASGIRLLAAGTDGRDGVTEAAGGVVDRGTWQAMQQAGVDPARALDRHESTLALAAVNAVIPRRRTGTNVMDVVIGLIE